MAPQIAEMAGADSSKRYHGRITLFVTVAIIATSSVNFALGYDIVIAGGVAATNNFLEEFFPTILRERKDKNNYCRYNNQLLQLFVSSLYLATLFGCLVASYTSRVWGRRGSFLVGGVLFIIGTCFQTAAQNLAMLIVGRALQGSGVGLGLQASTLYTAEVAPAHARGKVMAALEIWFTLGYFFGGIANYQSAKITPWGWRLSLGLAIVPGLLWTLGAWLLPDSPTSLLQRGHAQEARRILERCRGTPDVDAEFEDIAAAVNRTVPVKQSFKALKHARYRPQLIVGLLIPFFFQATGSSAVNFYAPVFFRSVGFGSEAALYSTAILGGVKFMASLILFPVIDRYGRKVLLYAGGVQMFIFLICVGAILQHNYELSGTLSRGTSIALVVVVCLFGGAFSCSWGALTLVVTSEIYPLEIRPVGMSLTTSFYCFLSFVVAQTFLSMLCAMRYGVYYFFAFWVIVMTVFAAAFLPETNQVALEQASKLFEQHWFWKRVVPVSSDVQTSKPHEDL